MVLASIRHVLLMVSVCFQGERLVFWVVGPRERNANLPFFWVVGPRERNAKLPEMLHLHCGRCDVQSSKPHSSCDDQSSVLCEVLCFQGESMVFGVGLLLVKIMACSNVSRRHRLVAKPAGENHLLILRSLLREQRYLEYCASSKENPYCSRCLW